MTLSGQKFNVSPGIQAFAGQVEEGASTSLDLLRAIDLTVDALNKHQMKLMPNLEMAHWLLGMLEKTDGCGEPIDPENELDQSLERAQHALQGFVDGLKIMQRSAYDDCRLCGHHEEAVVTAYQETIDLASDIFEAVEELRVHIREYDADNSSVTKQGFTSAEDIIEALDLEE